MTSDGILVHVNRIETAEPVTADQVKRAVLATAEATGVEDGEISITFLDATAIAALNESHLQSQGPTDVIAFNLAEPKEPLGDVYICPDVARQSAEEYDVELREELMRLVVHGVLHVFGYDHPEGPEREESEMFRRQEAILARVL